MTSWTKALLLLSLASLAAHLVVLPDYVQDQDGFHYVRGVERYSVAEVRPHFPGYPLYVWLGKLFALCAQDTPRALLVLSVLSTVLMVWPIALLTRSWSASLGLAEDEARRAGLAAALIWSAIPGAWLSGSEIGSDPPGLLLALLALLMCWRSLEHPERAGHWLAAAALASGLMLGTRPTFFLFLAPLAYATWVSRRRPAPLSFLGGGLPAQVALLFLASVVPWLGWLMAHEGAGPLLRIGVHHLGWHVGRFDNTVIHDPDISGRPVRLLRLTTVYNLGCWWPGDPGLRIPVAIGLAALLAAAVARLSRTPGSRERALPWLWAGPYVMVAVLGLDLKVPRYGLPVAALVCLMAPLGLPRRRGTAYAVLGALLVGLAVVTLPLAREHGVSSPAAWRLARHLRANFDPAHTLLLISSSEPPDVTIFLKEEARAFSLAPADPSGKSARAFEERGYVVLATEPAAAAPEEWVPLARFCRDRLLDPRGALEVWLFRHEPGARSFPAVPECG